MDTRARARDQSWEEVTSAGASGASLRHTSDVSWRTGGPSGVVVFRAVVAASSVLRAGPGDGWSQCECASGPAGSVGPSRCLPGAASTPSTAGGDHRDLRLGQPVIPRHEIVHPPSADTEQAAGRDHPGQCRPRAALPGDQAVREERAPHAPWGSSHRRASAGVQVPVPVPGAAAPAGRTWPQYLRPGATLLKMPWRCWRRGGDGVHGFRRRT